MTRSPPQLHIPLKRLDAEARDGRYQLLADNSVFALGRWADGQWVYPGGAELEFDPHFYFPATRLVNPHKVGGDG